MTRRMGISGAQITSGTIIPLGLITEPMLSQSLATVSTATGTLGSATVTQVTYAAATCALTLPASTTTWAVAQSKWIRKSNTSAFGITVAPNSGGTVNGAAVDAVFTLPGSTVPSSTTTLDMCWLVTRDGTNTWRVSATAQVSRVAALVQSYDPLAAFPSCQTIQTISRICHFENNAASAVDPYLFTANSGANGSGTVVAGRVGTASYTTSTSASAAPCLTTSASAFNFGAGLCRWRADIVLATASDGTETFTTRFGFNDSGSATPGNGVDGAYFRYTHSVNSGRWECVTTSNSVETATDSGVAGISASYQCLEIEVNAAGTSVNFRINGASVATNTTNIPTGTARATGINAHIVKSAGTTARSFEIDLMSHHCELTTAI